MYVECVSNVFDDACVLVEGFFDSLGVVVEGEDLFNLFGCGCFVEGEPLFEVVHDVLFSFVVGSNF